MNKDTEQLYVLTKCLRLAMKNESRCRKKKDYKGVTHWRETAEAYGKQIDKLLVKIKK